MKNPVIDLGREEPHRDGIIRLLYRCADDVLPSLHDSFKSTEDGYIVLITNTEEISHPICIKYGDLSIALMNTYEHIRILETKKSPDAVIIWNHLRSIGSNKFTMFCNLRNSNIIPILQHSGIETIGIITVSNDTTITPELVKTLNKWI